MKGGLFGLNRRTRKNKINTCYDKINKLDIKYEIDEIILALKETYQDNTLLDNYSKIINRYLYLLTDNKYSNKIFSYSDKNRELIEKELLEILGQANIIILRIISHKDQYYHIVRVENIRTNKNYNNKIFSDSRDNLMKDIKDLKDVLVNLKKFYYNNKNNRYLKNIIEKIKVKKGINMSRSLPISMSKSMSRSRPRSRSQSRPRSRSQSMTRSKTKNTIYGEY
jgi:hypothetical protein